MKNSLFLEDTRKMSKVSGARPKGRATSCTVWRDSFVPFALAFVIAAVLGNGQTAATVPLNERVMVVYNAAVKESGAVAKYYMEKRSIPKENLCKIDTSEEWLADDEWFEPAFKKPLRSCLEKIGKQKILYIVMSYHTPFGIEMDGHARAVDQVVADIWDEYAGARALGRTAGSHPYFGEAQSQGNAYEPFVTFAKYRDAPLAKTIYSVWRLDAATEQLAKGLVDKALYAETNGLKGKAYFDIRGGIQSFSDNGYGAGEWDIYRASQFAKKAGFDTTLDEKGTEFGTPPSQLRCENAALYAGWYSLQHYNDAFSWVPGAIGFHLDSASATNPRSANNWSGGALIRGITVTSGALTEPFLEGLVHPDQVFLYLFEGANVGDAVLRGTRWLKWMILNFGDPLYRPFPEGAGPYGSTIYRESWLGITPNTLVGGGAATGTIILGDNINRPVAVAFKSTNPELVTLPADSSIPAAGNGARFPIAVKEPAEPTSVTVSVTAGSETLTNTLNLYPLLMDLTLSQPGIKGDGTITGTVTIYVPGREQGVIVKLRSDHSEANVPPEVRIPGGAAKATFPITANGVKAEITVTITASIDNALKTAQLKIAP
jgi:uncharacterized protein (TIGR03790 family)